ncbi:MAG: hypothetical protein MJ240_07755 [Kiritimatiellae bacterium]|nr:hypothetical protein [Kiritimatiellia bacterium]
MRSAHPPPDVNLRRGATGVRHASSRKYGRLPQNPTRLGQHATTARQAPGGILSAR